MSIKDDFDTSLLVYLRDEVVAIRCLRRKLQRTFHIALSNEEVAHYWASSSYGEYFRGHHAPAGLAA